jgi:hypothetical protein
MKRRIILFAVLAPSVLGWSLAPVGWGAAQAGAQTSPTSTTVPSLLGGILGTTPTTAPATTTTTIKKVVVKPAPTTTTGTLAPTATSVKPSTGAKPKVPTAGPPTTVGTGPTVAPPPVANVGALLLGIQSDVDQLQALGNLTTARTAAAAAGQQTNQVRTRAEVADGDLTSAEVSRRQAGAAVTSASRRLATLAVAAYTGEENIDPVTDPASSSAPGVLGPQVGADQGGSTVLLSASMEASDAAVLLAAVVSQAQSSLIADRRRVAAADKQVAAAESRAARATAQVIRADQAEQSAQQVLTDTMAAATTPGVAIPGPFPANGASSPPATLVGAGVGAAVGAAPAILPSAATTATTAAIPAAGSAVPSPSVLGPSALTASEVAGWFASTGRAPNITVPMPELAADYLKAGQQTGVRADIAFAQSVVETGFFSFPSYGQLTPTDNNFAGIGACDSCKKGWSFPNAQTGVSAQFQLLDAYASPTLVPTPLVGPVGVGGCCNTWLALSGTWATNPDYGVEILTVYKQMLDWALPGRLAAAGLGAPVAAPGVAPTPGASPPVSAPLLAPTPSPPGTTRAASHG